MKKENRENTCLFVNKENKEHIFLFFSLFSLFTWNLKKYKRK